VHRSDPLTDFDAKFNEEAESHSDTGHNCQNTRPSFCLWVIICRPTDLVGALS